MRRKSILKHITGLSSAKRKARQRPHHLALMAEPLEQRIAPTVDPSMVTQVSWQGQTMQAEAGQ